MEQEAMVDFYMNHFESRERLYHVTLSSQHTYTAVVSGCQGIQSDDSYRLEPLREEAGPAPRLHAVAEMHQPVVAMETASASAVL